MRALTEFAAGEVVAARYRVVSLLGEGAANLVYRADRLSDGLRVALKVPRGGAGNLSGVERLWREAEFLARVDSPHLARLYECVEVEGAPVLVLEHLEGEDLSRWVTRGAQLPPAEAAALVASACRGVADLHRRGVLHRDIKPSNLFRMGPDGAGEVKVLDLGLAAPSRPAATEDPGVTRSDAVVGTPRYLAPEVVRDPTTASPASDVWSLGVVLYELLCGHPPFEAATSAGVLARVVADPPVPLRARRSDLPAELITLVERTLSKQPAERPRDAEELGHALMAWLDTTAESSTGLSVTHRSLTAPVGPSVRAAAPRTRHGWVLGACATLLLGLGWFGAGQGAPARSHDPAEPSRAAAPTANTPAETGPAARPTRAAPPPPTTEALAAAVTPARRVPLPPGVAPVAATRLPVAGRDPREHRTGAAAISLARRAPEPPVAAARATGVPPTPSPVDRTTETRK